MSEKNALAYMKELGVSQAMQALEGPPSLPLTLDCLSSRPVSTETYELFAGLPTLIPDSLPANEAYRAIGRELFGTGNTPLEEVLHVDDRAELVLMAAKWHKMGNLVILLDESSRITRQGMRPYRHFSGFGRLWDVAGPFMFSVVQQPTSHREIIHQDVSREPVREAFAPIKNANGYSVMVFAKMK